MELEQEAVLDMRGPKFDSQKHTHIYTLPSITTKTTLTKIRAKEIGQWVR